MADPKHQSQHFDREAVLRANAIRTCHRSCIDLFNSKVFGQGPGPLFEAAVVNMLINLNDLVRKADNAGKRIAFINHVDIVEGVKDVTDLITKCRNAACHIGSPLHDNDSNRFRLIVIAGKQPAAFKFDDKTLSCDFDDDIALYYGKYRLYLGRHIAAALAAVEHVFEEELAPLRGIM